MTKLDVAKKILDHRHQGQFWYLEVEVKEVVQCPTHEDLWYVVAECNTRHPNYTEETLEVFVLDEQDQILAPRKYGKDFHMKPEKLGPLAEVVINRHNLRTSAGGGGSWSGVSSGYEVSYHVDEAGRFIFRAKERPRKYVGLTVVTDKDVGSIVHDFELPPDSMGGKMVTVELASAKQAVVITIGHGKEKEEVLQLQSYSE